MIQICGSLGICQAFDSQGYGLLSCSKFWKPIHLFRYQKIPETPKFLGTCCQEVKAKEHEVEHVEKGQAQIGEVQS